MPSAAVAPRLSAARAALGPAAKIAAAEAAARAAAMKTAKGAGGLRSADGEQEGGQGGVLEQTAIHD